MTRLFSDPERGDDEQPGFGFSESRRETPERGAPAAQSEPSRAPARAARAGEPARADFFRSKRRPVLPVIGLVGAVATVGFFLWLGRDEDPPPAPELAPVASAPGIEAPFPEAGAMPPAVLPSPGSLAATAEPDPSIAPPATAQGDAQAGGAAAPAEVAALAEPAPVAAVKPAPPAEREPETPAVVRNAFSVQLLAARSESDVGASWERLRGAHPDLLASLSPTVARTDRAPGDTFYRLRAGPLPDRSAADALCKALTARRQSCFVVPPGS